MSAELILQAAMSGLLMGLIYALVAAGLSLIFGLMDVVNFAHGELMMLAMYATFFAWQATGLDPLLSLPMVAVLLFGIGVAIYRLLIARALSVPFNRGMVQIFVTFGLAIFIRGAAQFAFGGEFRSVNASWLANRSVDVAGVYLPLPQVAASLVCLLAFAGLLLISRTEFGRALEATREDRDAVALIGIDRDRIFALGWGLGAATVGVAGVMLADLLLRVAERRREFRADRLRHRGARRLRQPARRAGGRAADRRGGGADGRRAGAVAEAGRRVRRSISWC